MKGKGPQFAGLGFTVVTKGMMKWPPPMGKIQLFHHIPQNAVYKCRHRLPGFLLSRVNHLIFIIRHIRIAEHRTIHVSACG